MSVCLCVTGIKFEVYSVQAAQVLPRLICQLVRFATLFTLTEDHCGGSGMSPFRSTNHTDGLDRDLADGTSNLANDGKYHQPQGWSWLTKRRKQ